MHIAVNLLPFRARLAGAGRYTQNLLRELVHADAANEYLFFVTPRAAAHFDYRARNVSRILVALPESRAVRILYEQLILPIQLVRYKVELLFTPSVAIPCAPFVHAMKRVTVIYDMIAEHDQVTKYSPLRRVYMRWMSRYAAQHSDRVITLTEHARREIAHYARVAPEKIVLAPPAPDPRLQPIRDPETLRRVRKTYALPERFVLYLGTLEPGKNLERLVHAFIQMKRAHPELPHHLVLAGARGWGTHALERALANSRSSAIHCIGFVAENDLAALYSLADLFVYPSLYEGFGLPPLEAMACGTPVIVSNVASLPEVVGDAATLFDPYNVAEMADALARGLSDAVWREQIRAAGCVRVQKFSWTASARVVLNAIHAVGK